MMGSFNDVLDSIKTTLEGDTALQTFCASNFSAALTVKRVFKRRTGISAFPVILITRPEVKKMFLVGARDGTHTMRLYCGFQQPDREKAQDNIVEFEELIDDALLNPEPAALSAMNIKPTVSVNDEGMYHPYYFIVMDVEVHHRR
jgi:hypothetical protein